MNDGRVPEAGELVYVPEGSWAPIFLAGGLAAILAGIFVWFPYGVIGAIVALVALRSMVRAAREDVDRLPRRQRISTAVLPTTQPRRPGI